MKHQKRHLPPGTRGSAVITALVLGTVLMIVIAGVATFTSYRVSASTQEWNNIKALAIAEAGISCALTELSYNAAFKTNKVNKDTNLTWGAEENNSQCLENNSVVPLAVKPKTKGTYWATFGDGEFKVKIGNIECNDNSKTLNVDESKCFLKVESMGFFNDTVRKVTALVQKRFPAREFLMYDGGVLSIVYGELGESTKTNLFSDGHLYGKLGVEIGQILMNKHVPGSPGTKQGFRNIELLTTPKNIYVYSDSEITFRDKPDDKKTLKKNTSYPTGGTYPGGGEAKGEMAKELLDLETPPAIDDVQGKFLKDGAHGGTNVELTLSYEKYKKDATSGGLVVTGDVDYKLPAGWPGGTVKAKVLDFGSTISPNSGAPSPGNGVIYSDDSLIIKGNPPRDLTIVSKKNVFVAGDFNQAGKPSNGPNDKERYGFPQNYDKNALFDENYVTDGKTLLESDKTKAAADRHHQPVTVIANERIVYDYRNPIDCFENEIYPFMKYELAAKLSCKPSPVSAETNILKVSGSNEIDSPTAAKADIETAVKDFFTKYPLGDTTKETAIVTEIKDSYNETAKKFTAAELETVTQKVWKGYKENYPNKVNDTGFGVYKLLNGLRAKLTGKTESTIKADNWTDNKDDYLYFPEITTSGMFISCGVLNTLAYAGPDVAKLFDEIGNKGGQTGVGEQHSPHQTFVHRLYGSECKLRTNTANPYVSGGYDPPVRKKLYDPILPGFWPSNDANDLVAFVLIGWEDFKASTADYNHF